MGPLKSDGQAQKQAHERSMLRIWVAAIAAFMIIVAILIGFTLHLGYESAAIEIVKALVYLSAGAFGGYGFGRLQSKPKDAQAD